MRSRLLPLAAATLLAAVATALASGQDTTDEQEKLYQELTVAQKSVYRIQGLDSQADLQYAVLSSLTLQSRSDGSLTVQQKIEAAKLIRADALAKTILSDLLRKLEGTTWEMAFSPQRELTRFEGGKDFIRAVAGNDPPGAQTFILASLVDQDGWKELSQLSFFRPRTPLRIGAKWQRAATHSWGSLGAWTGRVAYTYAGKQGSLQRFPYAFRLTYAPPQGQGRGLPFQIAKAAFKHLEAGGTIYFDVNTKRVSHVEERFHVQGELSVSLLGQNIPVEVDEDQRFHVRILDYSPEWR